MRGHKSDISCAEVVGGSGVNWEDPKPPLVVSLAVDKTAKAWDVLQVKTCMFRTIILDCCYFYQLFQNCCFVDDAIFRARGHGLERGVHVIVLSCCFLMMSLLLFTGLGSVVQRGGCEQHLS